MTIQIHKISKSDLFEIQQIDIEVTGMPSNTNGMTISHYADAMRSTHATIPFTIEGVEEFIPYVNEIEFCMVIRQKIDMDAIGPNEKTIKDVGKDIGKYDYRNNAPSSTLDLPPGFIEFYNGNA